MGKFKKAQLDDGTQRLMMLIGETIRLHTTHTPMSHETIIGVLGFCAGAAIVRVPNGRNRRRQLRDMAAANIDSGMEAMERASAPVSSLILPGDMH